MDIDNIIIRDNCVTGVKSIGINFLLVKQGHVQYVSADRHPVTVRKTIKNNSVKVARLIKIEPSPGKERYERQVSLDPHLSTVRIRQKQIQGHGISKLNHCGQLENIKQGMRWLNVNILEYTKLCGKGSYAGREKNERGVRIILNQDMKKCFLGY